MIVEELDARLGFKIEGLDKVRKFERGIKAAKVALDQFGKASNKAVAASPLLSGSLFAKGNAGTKPVWDGEKWIVAASGLKAIAATAAKAAPALKTASSATSTLGLTFARLALGAGAVGAAIGVVVAIGYKLSRVMADAAGKAAVLRREMQLDAKQNRTSAQNLDKTAKGYEAIGASADDAKEAVAALAKAANEGILDPEKASFLKKRGISLMDGAGNQRDVSAVLDDVTRDYLSRQAQQDTLRKAAAGTLDSSKQNVAKNKFEKAFRKDLPDYEKFGLTSTVQKFLGGIKDYAEYSQRRESANRLSPAATDLEEAQKKRLAEAYTRSQISGKAVGENYSRSIDRFLADWNEGVLKFQNAVNEFEVGLQKRAGIAPYTRGELDEQSNAARAGFLASERNSRLKEDDAEARSEASRERNRARSRTLQDTPEVAAARAADAAKPKTLLEAFFGTELGNRLSKLDRLKQNSLDAPGNFSGNARRKAISGDIVSTLQSIAASFEAIENEISPATQAEKIGADAARTDNRSYQDVGNDYRTVNAPITINQTVSGAGDAAMKAGAGAKGGLNQAVQMMKGSTSATLSDTSP